MALNLCVLASGSTGNATLLWADNSALLIDCGRSKRFIEESLKSLQVDITRVKGILITHGHGDHINSGTIILARTHAIPIYIHAETYTTILGKKQCEPIARLDRRLIRHHTLESFVLDEFRVQPFTTFHNGGFAGRTFGFSIIHDDGQRRRKIGFLTDTGKIDDAIIEALADSHALVLEANHDPELVRNSDRHPVNKQWVLSDYGHLSNAANANAIREIIRRSKRNDILKHIFVAHISEQHNTPAIALRHIRTILNEYMIENIELIPTFHRAKSIVVNLA
jgi:phosphoribosyl 1,2-cyclic phosphodiesterase